MRKNIRLLVSISIFLVIFPLRLSSYGGWIKAVEDAGFTDPQMKVISSDQHKTIIEINIAGVESRNIFYNGESFQRLSIPEGFTTCEVGKPELPKIITKIGIPARSDVSLRVVEKSFIQLENFHIFPVPEPTTDDQPFQFAIDREFYKQDLFYPQEIAEISPPAIWRDCRIVSLAIHPVQFNPATGKINLYSKIVVELVYFGESDLNIKEFYHSRISPSLKRSYESQILNYKAYEELELKAVSTDAPGPKYLVITVAPFQNAISPLVEWRNKSGLKAKVAPLSEVGSTVEAIYNYIKNHYQNFGIEHVLLVGDVDDLPINTTGDPSDHYYACVDGNDLYADVGVGRLTAKNLLQIQTQLTKILRYEKNPPGLGDWFRKTILAAHEQDAPGKYQGCKEEIRTFNYQFITPIFDTAYAAQGATNQTVIDAINEGRGIVNYRGHGSETEWSWAPQWGADEIARINCGGKNPIVLNICCLNGAVHSSGTCLAESWQFEENGSTGNLAATEPSYTAENHVFDKQLYKAFFDIGLPTVIDVVNNAKNTIIDLGVNGQANAKMYLWLGDPAMTVYTTRPVALNAEYPGVVPVGESEFEIDVTKNGAPVKNALVCLYSPVINLYETQYTNAAGHCSIPIAPTDVGELQITVTAQNSLPYEASIPILVSGCGIVSLNRSTYNCSDPVVIKLWDDDLNINPQGIDTAQVLIKSTSEPQGETVTLTETEPDLGAFRGEIRLSSTQSGPGYLLVYDSDLIEVIYNDADCEGSPTVANDTATTDCIGPVISNIQVTDLTESKAVIKWKTNEFSNSTVRYGKNRPPQNEVKSETLAIDHSVEITGLEEDTLYYYEVQSTDAYGNTTVENNGGQYIQFRTKDVIVLFHDDFTFNRGWSFSDNQWERDVPRGLGGGGFPFPNGNPDPTEDHTTGTGKVLGTDLTVDGNYNQNTTTYATSRQIDCSNASGVQLRFYRWLNVGEGMFPIGNGDNAFIEVSNNGFTWVEIWRNTEDVTDNEWIYREYDISKVADGQPRVQIRFGISARALFGTYSGWNIDDLIVRGYSKQAFPTNTPTFLPSATPTPSAPGPTETPTPTFTTGPGTPSNTPPPTAIPTATPTPPIIGNPVILIAGYMMSNISSLYGGTLDILAYAVHSGSGKVKNVEVYYAGNPIGLNLPEYIPDSGVFWLSGFPIGSGAGAGKYLFDLIAQDQFSTRSTSWPYLVVK